MWDASSVDKGMSVLTICTLVRINTLKTVFRAGLTICVTLCGLSLIVGDGALGNTGVISRGVKEYREVLFTLIAFYLCEALKTVGVASLAL